MPFNSLAFFLFFFSLGVVTYVLPAGWRRTLLLAASYFFYGYWDWRFLPLVMAATAIDYFIAFRITPGGSSSDRKRKYWLVTSLVAQLGMLAFFKYTNFLLTIVAPLLSAMHLGSGAIRIDLILPLGISFYTFKTLTYTVDVYRGQLLPTPSLLDYALHVSFFANIVAGPIERARNFLPQLVNVRRAEKAQIYEGLHLIFWGLFKKIFVADNLAGVVARQFSAAEPTGFQVLLGAYAFAVQIFCDFSGYTDIARGCAKCLGIELSENFRQPYLATSTSDFWQRWHITLSTWLRDYIFLPLGGAFGTLPRAYRNLAITMVLAGLWHGASWTFVLWGAYWAILLVGHRVLQPVMKHNGAWFRKQLSKPVRKGLKIFITVQLVCLGWLIFRAESLGQVWNLLTALFSWHGAADFSLLVPVIRFAGFYLLIELVLLLTRTENLYRASHSLVWVRTVIYAIMFYYCAFYGSSAESFIYAQF